MSKPGLFAVLTSPILRESLSAAFKDPVVRKMWREALWKWPIEMALFVAAVWLVVPVVSWRVSLGIFLFVICNNFGQAMRHDARTELKLRQALRGVQ
jgi:hypothetical protein